VEAEIWPNLLWQAESNAIPVSLVNARLSDSSYRGYRRAGFLFRRIFSSLSSVGAQAEEDIARWVELGCRRESVALTGNIKFDIVPDGAPGRVDARSLVRGLGIAPDAKIIVGGSTHAGEERILAEVFKALKKSNQSIFLIVVPRHMERGAAIAREIASLGLTVCRRSAIGGQPSDRNRPLDCLVVDSTGELIDFYAIADVVFVGKSLTGRGGQNPLEPAKFGKPIICGDKMGNFRAIVRLLLLERAVIIVENQALLETELARILKNNELTEVLAENARRAMAKNAGSLTNTCELLVNGKIKGNLRA
jgi:3-deoxy-D-manno-octulosonic-acid transferase